MNVVSILPSVGVRESSFCDTLDIVRSHKDQNLIVGTQALVDPLDDEMILFVRMICVHLVLALTTWLRFHYQVTRVFTH